MYTKDVSVHTSLADAHNNTHTKKTAQFPVMDINQNYASSLT